jgi:hypothetical protein
MPFPWFNVMPQTAPAVQAAPSAGVMAAAPAAPVAPMANSSAAAPVAVEVASTEKPVAAVVPASGPQDTPPVVRMVVITPPAAEADQPPVKVTEFASPQPVPVPVPAPVVSADKPDMAAAETAPPFDYRRFVNPLLGFLALLALIIWGRKRARASKTSVPASSS